MSPGVLLYLAGMALVFVGQRLFGEDSLSLPLTALGVLMVLGSVGMRFRLVSEAPSPQAADAHRKALAATGAGLLSLVVYGLSLESTAEALLGSEEAVKRWTVSLTALWPILWALATAPLVLIDLAIQDNPRVVQPVRVRQALDNGLVMALGLALVFPVNYLASELNHRFDLAYFKTARPGDSTRGIVENLASPVVVRIFLPTSSDVAPELSAYFDVLKGPNLRYEIVDHAADPALARALKVRDNGYVAVSLDDGSEEPATKSWKVGDDLDDARRNLKKLDEEFRKRLLDLAKGKRTAYFTVGHDELNWRGGELPEDKLSTLKKVLEAMNFKVAELGLAEGLGQAVPDDAAMVFVVGPKEPLLDAEEAALRRFVDGGGKLFVAVEPGGDALSGLLGHLGLARAEGTLASASDYVRRTGELGDRVNLITNRFSSHESTTNLSRYSRQLPMVVPGAAALDEVPGGQGKVTVTVRTLDSAFLDLDGDLEEGEGESRASRAVAAAVSPGDEGFRALVLGDATALSDLALASAKGNQVFVLDGVGWLLDEAELGGAVESEEDVKIEHTREDQVTWFYTTIAGVPLLVLAAGLVHTRRRRSGGAA